MKTKQVSIEVNEIKNCADFAVTLQQNCTSAYAIFHLMLDFHNMTTKKIIKQKRVRASLVSPGDSSTLSYPNIYLGA